MPDKPSSAALKSSVTKPAAKPASPKNRKSPGKPVAAGPDKSRVAKTKADKPKADKLKSAKPATAASKSSKSLRKFAVRFQPVEIVRNRDGSLRLTTVYNIDTPPRSRSIEAATVAEAFDLVAKAARRHAKPCYAVIAPVGDVSKAFAKSFNEAYDALDRFHNLPAA